MAYILPLKSIQKNNHVNLYSGTPIQPYAKGAVELHHIEVSLYPDSRYNDIAIK